MVRLIFSRCSTTLKILVKFKAFLFCFFITILV
nr:MAG TPA: hypothetical protein [Caudoviricetes sp.]